MENAGGHPVGQIDRYRDQALVTSCGATLYLCRFALLLGPFVYFGRRGSNVHTFYRSYAAVLHCFGNLHATNTYRPAHEVEKNIHLVEQHGTPVLLQARSIAGDSF